MKNFISKFNNTLSCYHCSDLEPLLHIMPKAFANHRTDKLQHKICQRKCAENKKCTKKCMEQKEGRKKEVVLVDKVKSKLAPIIRALERGEDPDTIVMVEYREFACSGIVLGSYSVFFRKFRGHTMIDLRRGPMTADTFEQIYKWMVKPYYKFQPSDVVRVIRAASFLEITELLNECYGMLDSDLFRDFWAIDIMNKSRHFNELFQINQAMAFRISTSTLILLCSQEFLNFNEMQICALLSSSSLAVNAESEVGHPQ